MEGDANFELVGASKASASLPSYSAVSVRNSVLSGYAAGICGIVVGHPLDSLKVLIQTNNGGAVAERTAAAASASASAASSITSASADTAITRAAASAAAAGAAAPSPPASTTLAQAGQGASGATAAMSTSAAAAVSPKIAEAASPAAVASTPTAAARGGGRSLRSLYAGMSGPLLTVGVIQSVNFALYDSFRRILHRLDHPDCSKEHYLHNDSLSNVAASSFAAGAVISIMTSPLMVVKTKQQIMVWSFRKAVEETYGGGRATRFRMRNFFTGFGPHLFCDSFGRAVYFTSYEILKRSVIQWKAPSHDRDVAATPAMSVTVPERMACAALAGMACWSVIFPADVLRSKMYAQTLSSQRRTTWQMAEGIFREGGGSFRPFYRGFAITVARAGPVAAAVLPVYDLALDWLTTAS